LSPKINGLFTLKWVLNWRLTITTLLLFPVLISLGFWQLHRAREKQTIQQSWLHEQAKPPVHYREAIDNRNSFRRVFTEGEYDLEHYWLLENKMLNGRLGYQVISPFKTSYGDWLLLNRGWVQADAYRDVNPEVSTPPGRVRVTGTFNQPSDSRFIEHKAELMTAWPYRLLEVDVPLMTTQFEQALEPSVLRLDADSPGAFATDWQPINMKAEKHRAYAMQWFAMAAALVFAWFMANTNILQLLSRNKNE